MNWSEIKKRLKNMLAYDWMKIVVLVIAVVALWLVIFQTAGTPVTPGQNFGVFYYYTLDDKSAALLNFMQDKQCFSSCIYDKYAYRLNKDYADQVLATREATYDGDIMVIDDEEGVSAGNFKGFVDAYADVLYDYDGLYADAKEYVRSLLNDPDAIESVISGYSPDTAGFSKQAYFDANFNAQKIESLFRRRCVEDSSVNKKYRSESQKLAGIEEEKARIKVLFENVCDLKYLLENHSDMFVNYRRYDFYNAVSPEVERKDQSALTSLKYGLDTRYIKNHSDSAKTNVTEYFDISTRSSEAKMVYITVYNYKMHQYHEQYETLSFVNTVIRECSTLLNGR